CRPARRKSKGISREILRERKDLGLGRYRLWRHSHSMAGIGGSGGMRQVKNINDISELNLSSMGWTGKFRVDFAYTGAIEFRRTLMPPLGRPSSRDHFAAATGAKQVG